MLSIPYKTLLTSRLRLSCYLEQLRRLYHPTPDTPITVEMVLKSNDVFASFWFLEKLNPNWLKRFSVEYAIWNAEQVLPIFEKECPNENWPRQCIDAAKAWLADPTAKNAEVARAAKDWVADPTAKNSAAHAAGSALAAARAAAAFTEYQVVYAAIHAAHAAGSALAAARAAAAFTEYQVVYAAFEERQETKFLELLRKYDDEI